MSAELERASDTSAEGLELAYLQTLARAKTAEANVKQARIALAAIGRSVIGGKRGGAGRKRVIEGELLTTVAFGLAQQHVEAIKRWQAHYNCPSASAAVRQMIDHAHHCPNEFVGPVETILSEHYVATVVPPRCAECGTVLLFGPHDHRELPAVDPLKARGPTQLTPAENLLAVSAVDPAGGENDPDWQWKRQPISRPTRESRTKRAKPKQ